MKNISRMQRILRKISGKLDKIRKEKSTNADLSNDGAFFRQSYSQSGEDVIVAFILDCLSLSNPTYIDIGANHPFQLNNTAHFYQRGFRGINIEPNPYLFTLLEKYREQDINLNIGVADKEGIQNFYVMSSATMSTFSADERSRLEKDTSMSVSRILEIKTDILPNIITKYSNGIFPDFLSLDVEGLEQVILNSIDYANNSPKIICIETLTYTEDNTEEKEQGLITFLTGKGYILFADTYINSIFVKKDAWISRRR